MPQSHTLCLFVVFLILFIWLRVFFIATYELLVAACGIQFPNQGSNPGLLHWELEVLATGPLGKSSQFLAFSNQKLLTFLGSWPHVSSRLKAD